MVPANRGSVPTACDHHGHLRWGGIRDHESVRIGCGEGPHPACGVPGGAYCVSSRTRVESCDDPPRLSSATLLLGARRNQGIGVLGVICAWWRGIPADRPAERSGLRSMRGSLGHAPIQVPATAHGTAWRDSVSCSKTQRLYRKKSRSPTPSSPRGSRLRKRSAANDTLGQRFGPTSVPVDRPGPAR